MDTSQSNNHSEASPNQHPEDSQYQGEDTYNEEEYTHGEGEDHGEEYDDGEEHDENDEGEDHEEFEGYDEEHQEGDVLMEQHSRRIKRDITENLNKVRKQKDLPRLYNDLFSTLIATDYAEFLKTNEHDSDLFKQLCEEYNVLGDLRLVYTISKFEEDVNISETFHQDFIDLGHLLLEVETDRRVLLDPSMNHIGIGVTMTPENLILVEVFSNKLVTVTKISDGEDGGIEIRGKMLSDTKGLYAVKLQTIEAKKDFLVGPENIEFDHNSKDFIVFLDVDEAIGGSNKLIELYIRNKPETIEYKKASKEKLNLKHLELAHRCPCMVYPDPRYLAQDEHDRMRKEQETLEKMRIDEERKQKKEEEKRERIERRKHLRQEIEERRARGEEIESLASSTQRSNRSFLSKGSLAPKDFESKMGVYNENPENLQSPERSFEGEKK